MNRLFYVLRVSKDKMKWSEKCPPGLSGKSEEIVTFLCHLAGPTPITLWQQNLMPRGAQGSLWNAQPEDLLDSSRHTHSWRFNRDMKDRAGQGRWWRDGVFRWYLDGWRPGGRRSVGRPIYRHRGSICFWCVYTKNLLWEKGLVCLEVQFECFSFCCVLIYPSQARKCSWHILLCLLVEGVSCIFFVSCCKWSVPWPLFLID